MGVTHRKKTPAKATSGRSPNFERIRKVADAVELARVQMIFARAEGPLPGQERPPLEKTDIKARTRHKADDEGILVVQEILVQVPQKEDPEKPVAKSPGKFAVEVEVHLALKYLFHENEKKKRPRFSKKDVEAFAAINGRYNAWPYLRAYVERLTVDLGLPPLTLPLYRV